LPTVAAIAECRSTSATLVSDRTQYRTRERGKLEVCNMKRSASALWQGDLKQGQGRLATDSGVLKDTPYSFATRFQGTPGTNPEELLAAAHAGCFTMALTAALGGGGFVPTRIATRATVALEQLQGQWTISTVHLETSAHVPGITDERFQSVAADAKANCPVSRLFKAAITLEAKLDAA
jgi:lipoyl-dependent peroxiredoxin